MRINKFTDYFCFIHTKKLEGKKSVRKERTGNIIRILPVLCQKPDKDHIPSKEI